MAEFQDPSSSGPMTSIVRVAVIAVTVALFVGSTFNALAGQRELAIVFALATPLGISALGFARAGHNAAAVMLLCGVLVVVVTLALLLSPFGVHDMILMGYGGVVLMGALLLSRRHFYAITALIVAAGSMAFVMDLYGLTRSRLVVSPGWTALAEFVVMILVFAGIGRYCAEVLFGSLGDVHRAVSDDAVSGAASRPGFLDHAAKQLKAMAPGSHAMFTIADLDNFRRVNVLVGHRAGDNILREVATRLAGVPGVGLVGRIGDDEFAALTVGLAGEGGAQELARRIHDALQFDFAGVAVRTSVGFARYPRDADSLDALLLAAEGSLTRAKDHESERFAGPGDNL
ncbi:MAG TPA: GGDEF domain-containing protein [Usitatibacter sp.]|nr:GGDEF domain-containing protein [Usitatibacter sp.]